MSTTLATIPTPTPKTATELELAAQAAAELRLEAAYLVFEAESDGFDPDDDEYEGDLSREDFESADATLSGPFDGCNTCVVREVLDAAWPFMLELARLELAERAAAEASAA